MHLDAALYVREDNDNEEEIIVLIANDVEIEFHQVLTIKDLELLCISDRNLTILVWDKSIAVINPNLHFTIFFICRLGNLLPSITLESYLLEG